MQEQLSIFEEWRDVAFPFSRFQVSNYGRLRRSAAIVRSRYKPYALLKGHPNTLGRLQFHLRDDTGIMRMVLAHLLVASAFLSSKPTKLHEINHIDGNRQNNAADNLEWVTRSENMKHAFLIGLQCNKGEQHPSAKVTTADVMAIRSLPENQVRAAAAHYNLHPDTMRRIWRRKDWAHLP